MASYLVDFVLVVAPLVTSIRVTRMHRDLVLLRAGQGDFAAVLGKTNEAVDDMVVMVREFNAEGKQLVHALGSKIDEARKAVTDIEALGDAARRQT